MATLEQLSTALRNADAAGDADAARVLAAEITKMRGATAAPAVPVAEDVAKSVVAAVPKGIAGAAGFGGDVSSLAGHAADWIGRKLGDTGPGIFSDERKVQDRYKALRQAGFSHDDAVRTIGEYKEPTDYLTSAGIRKNVIEPVTGPLYEPKTTPGKIAGTTTEFVSNPMSYLGAGTIPAKIATAATAGAGSEIAGQATEGTKAEPYARILGAMGGSFAPSAAVRAVTPAPASPARQRLVDILNNEGVTSITAGQRTGNEALRYAESTLGNAPLTGQAANRMMREGQEQFTEAAMRRAGAGPDATPDVLAANQRRLGDTFRDLSARNTMQMDPQFGQDLGRAVRNYDRVPPSQQRAIVEGYVNDIVTHAQQGGTMPGPLYQEMRSRLSRQSNSLRQSDPTLSETLRDLRNALDDAMGRSIPAADREAWQAARREYGAQKVIEKAASRAGEATGEGQIVPANLRNAVSAENRGAYARGEGDFSELARAGATVMAPLPNSGTAQRLNALHLANDFLLGVPKALAGRALMSPVGQAIAGNQLGTPVLPYVQTNTPRAAIAALMAAQNSPAPFTLGGQ